MSDQTATDLCHVARKFLGQRQYARAIEYAEKAIAQDPENEWAFRLVANGARMLGLYEKSIAAAERVVELDPTNVYGLNCLASVCIGAGFHERAIEIGWEAVRLQPEEANNYWPIISGTFEVQRYAESAAAARSALALDPVDVQLRQHYGMALAAQQMADEALAVVAGYLKDSPDLSTSHTTAGWSYYHLGRLEEAASYFENAIRLDPSFPWQYEGLGIVRFDQGRWAEAKTLLTEAARLDSAMRKGNLVLDEIHRRIGQYPGPDYPTSDSRLI
jgi:tetratricopeptide (TPR) repeat protein